MYVIGIGNVTECNSSYIFLNTEGKQESIKATKERIEAVFYQSDEVCKAYWRANDDLKKEFEKRREMVEERYHFITDEEVQERYREGGYKNGIWLEVEQKVNNEECTRQYSAVYGFYDAVKYLSDKWLEINKLRSEAKAALNTVKR